MHKVMNVYEKPFHKQAQRRKELSQTSFASTDEEIRNDQWERALLIQKRKILSELAHSKEIAKGGLKFDDYDKFRGGKGAEVKIEQDSETSKLSHLMNLEVPEDTVFVQDNQTKKLYQHAMLVSKKPRHNQNLEVVNGIDNVTNILRLGPWVTQIYFTAESRENILKMLPVKLIKTMKIALVEVENHVVAQYAGRKLTKLELMTWCQGIVKRNTERRQKFMEAKSFDNERLKPRTSLVIGNDIGMHDLQCLHQAAALSGCDSVVTINRKPHQHWVC